MSEIELTIMKTLWSTGFELTANEVLDMSGLDWTIPAVMTQLTRLQRKGYVICEKKKNNVYTPTISKSEYQLSQCDKLLGSLFDGSLSDMLDVLYENGVLSETELAELAEHIAGMRKGK